VERASIFFMHVTTRMKEKCAQNAINLSIGLLTAIKTEFALAKSMIVKSMDDASVCQGLASICIERTLEE